MARTILTTNPEIRILQRQGKFFAGLLSGRKTPLILNELDIVLLALFNEGITTSDAVNAIKNLTPGVPPSLPPSKIIERVHQLHHAQVLVDSRSGANTSPVFSTPIRLRTFGIESTPSELNPELRLKWCNNLALEPTLNGFKVWSPLTRAYHTLSLELVLILVSFSSGKSVREGIAERTPLGNKSEIGRAMAWLSGTGLLVSAEELLQQRQSQTSIVAGKGSGSRQKNKRLTKSSEALGRQATLTWQKLKQDGRIPVYFVPHMPNHYPLALGMIYSFLNAYKSGLLLERYLPLPVSFMTANEIAEGPYKKFGRGVWLFSNYMWSVELNLKISHAIKSHNTENLTIHGGPSTPSYKGACSDFMKQNPSVDISVHGEGEVAVAEILEILGQAETTEALAGCLNEELIAATGITYRAGGAESNRLIRTEERPRVKDLDLIPSPYLTGVFDSYGAEVDAAIVESNRGCPFGCTFCDWGSATKQKVRKFDIQRVKDEIDWIGKNAVRVLWIADANFGIYDRDIEISKWICEAKERYGFPKEIVVNYTKNATKRLAEIVTTFNAGGICSQGIISIQTTDEVTLEVINRKNIKTEKYDDLASIFQNKDLPLSTDLMIGLPGITVEAFERDLQRYFDKDVLVKAYPTQLLPNSPMADPDYIQKYRIEVDENDYLVSTFSYTKNDLNEMKAIYNLFYVADGYSTLRYVLRYLQWEHGIPALEFLHRLLKEIMNFDTKYPAISWVSKFFLVDKCMPGGWKQFYDEIADFSEHIFGIHRDPGFNTVLRVNEMVMPDDAISYPLSEQLDHDFAAYFLDHYEKHIPQVKRINSYPPARLVIEDIYSLARIDYAVQQYDTHQVFWELKSPMSRSQSVPELSVTKS